jgi:hypothetical protein
LADITELPRGGKVIEMIQWQIGSMLGMPVGPKPVAASSGASYVGTNYVAPIQATQSTISSGTSGPPIQGTVVPGGSLAQKLAWLQKSADSHETYIIEMNAD